MERWRKVAIKYYHFYRSVVHKIVVRSDNIIFCNHPCQLPFAIGHRQSYVVSLCIRCQHYCGQNSNLKIEIKYLPTTYKLETRKPKFRILEIE